MKNRRLMVFGMVMAGLCLFRVLVVAAAERGHDDVEVYSSMEKGSHDSEQDSTDEEEGSESSKRAEIRLSRPDEAASRIADDVGHEQVAGAERLAGAITVPSRSGQRISESDLIVPKKVTAGPSRGLASSSAESEPVSTGKLSAEPMEPTRPFTTADAKARAQDFRSENIVVSNNPLQAGSYGLKSEPRVETKIDAAIPESFAANRSGTQEVSLIVSDYGYFPNRIFVTQGVPVKIFLTTPSKVTMCFMLDNWGLKKGVTPGKIEELTFTPDQVGDYRFYCPVKSIEGRITVKESPVAEASGRGVAAVDAPIEPQKPVAHNTPKNAGQLRGLIED